MARFLLKHLARPGPEVGPLEKTRFENRESVPKLLRDGRLSFKIDATILKFQQSDELRHSMQSCVQQEPLESVAVIWTVYHGYSSPAATSSLQPLLCHQFHINAP